MGRGRAAAQTAMDEWVHLFASRDEIAEAYADLLVEKPATWGVWPTLNLAIMDRWSRSGLEYVKRRAWRLAASRASQAQPERADSSGGAGGAVGL